MFTTERRKSLTAKEDGIVGRHRLSSADAIIVEKTRVKLHTGEPAITLILPSMQRRYPPKSYALRSSM